MLEKRAITNFDISQAKDIQPLNIPIFFGTNKDIIKHQFDNINTKVFNDTLTKIANTSTDDDNKFDLELEIKSHPDSLFVKCFAIKADEPNDNGDYFSKEELKKSTHTFIGVPVFTNHQNQDVEKARGKVVYSWWDEDKNGIMIVARVDAVAYPQLARSITQKYVLGTSMGAQVQYSLCSVCHNYAETPVSYCAHIKERKTRHIDAKGQSCQYHKNGHGEKCPLCGSTKNDTKIFSYSGKSFEYNYGIKFIENSFVVNPACHECGVTEVIDVNQFLSKVANIKQHLPGLIKYLDKVEPICTDQSCYKQAGQKELGTLNEALELITSVSQSMLKQKAQLDLEFLSDLIDVLADLQTVIDELQQQGYGQLPSPDGSQPETTAKLPSTTSQPSAATQPSTPISVPSTPVGNIPSGPAGPGTVTGPLANKKLDLHKFSKNIFNKHSISSKKDDPTLKIKFKIHK